MEKVLIIDDVLSNALLIKGYLRHMALDAVIFTDPKLALAWCTEHEPDLVLLDFMMPGMSGTDFLRQFRDNDRLRDVPVVVVTWDERKETLHEALKAGAADFLNKPIDRVELIVRMQNMIEFRSRRRELIEANASAAKLNIELVQKVEQLQAAYELIARDRSSITLGSDGDCGRGRVANNGEGHIQ